MFKGTRGHDTAPGGALDEALLDEIGFDNVFDGVAWLGQGRGDCFDADRAAAEILAITPR